MILDYPGLRRWIFLLGPALAGCSLSGLDSEYGATDASPDGTKADAGTGDSGGSDSSADGCQATENCANGVDDNCNGLVDCADPSCAMQGFACTAGAIPSGWTLVAYSAKTRPVCPAMYGAEQAIVSDPDGGADTCGCTCSGSSGTCVGTASYNGYPNACATGASGVNVAVNNGACGALGTTITSSDFYQLYYASTAQAQQGSCTGAGKITAAPTPTFNAGATCATPAHLGAGCSAGVCAPPTGTTFMACIAHPGTIACPTFGFTQQVLASTGSPGYVDGRTCGGCPCATSITCSTVTNVALFPNGNCSGGAAYNINTGCQLANSTVGIGSYEVAYDNGGDPSCQPTGASPPGGSVKLDANVETICCPP